MVAADQPAPVPLLGRAQGAQGVRHHVVPEVGGADPDAGDAGAAAVRAVAAHLVGQQAPGLGEVGAHRVLHGAGLLPGPGEDDPLLVQRMGVVVRAHGQRDVGHRALDVIELFAVSLECHAVSSP